MENVVFPIAPTHVLLFARAVGYEDQPGGPAPGGALPVPPTFTEAVRQFVPEDESARGPEPLDRLRGEPTGRPDNGAEEGKGTLFHAEQHFTYHRPIPVGSDVFASFRDGEEWTKRDGAAASSPSASESPSPQRGGELLVTSRLVSVETGRPVEASR